MIVDASVWISSFIRGDSAFGRSRAWLKSQAGADLIVPSLAFVEVAGAISRVQRAPARAARLSRWLRTSSNVTVIELTDTLMIQAADIAATLRLRGADAVYVAVADDLRLPLVTLDQELQQRAASIVSVIQP
jgi:predicted nucleic acid-binding protein